PSLTKQQHRGDACILTLTFCQSDGLGQRHLPIDRVQARPCYLSFYSHDVADRGDYVHINARISDVILAQASFKNSREFRCRKATSLYKSCEWVRDETLPVQHNFALRLWQAF